jgi:hypothetical protein
MSNSDSPPPVSLRFVAFADAVPHRTPVFVSPSWPDAGHAAWNFGVGSPTPIVVDAETLGSPRFLANPLVSSPRPRTPAGSTCLALTTCQLGPRFATRRRLLTTLCISGLNPAASTLAVYASPDGSPHLDARLASGCRLGSTGWDLLPIGFEHKVYEVFPTSPSSFPRLRLAQLV